MNPKALKLIGDPKGNPEIERKIHQLLRDEPKRLIDKRPTAATSSAALHRQVIGTLREARREEDWQLLDYPRTR